MLIMCRISRVSRSWLRLGRRVSQGNTDLILQLFQLNVSFWVYFCLWIYAALSSCAYTKTNRPLRSSHTFTFSIRQQHTCVSHIRSIQPDLPPSVISWPAYIAVGGTGCWILRGHQSSIGDLLWNCRYSFTTGFSFGWTLL